MAELLIVARDVRHADPEKDRRGCYKRGDVVVVEEDGHAWGAKEGLPRFVRLRITGAGKALAERLTEIDDEDDAGNPVTDEKGERQMYRRRRWNVDIAALPAATRNALASTGVASISRALVRARLRRKRDNLQFTGL